MTKLSRSLSLPLLVLYGMGNILGAGIYVLVGKVAGYAGYNTVWAFVLAMVLAGFTAMSYMELSGRYPVSGGAAIYIYEAFKKRWLSVLLGVAMVLSGITSAAALAQGFAGYFTTIVDVPPKVVALGLILVLGAVVARGIDVSARAAAVFTVLEVVGLLLVIGSGWSSVSFANIATQASLDTTVGVGGLLMATFLAFYAFIGFEDMANVAEEVKRPERTMPLGILFSLIGATALYILVVVVALSVLSPAELATSSAPLASVLQRSGSSLVGVLVIVGMVAALNGVIVQIIMGSRILYGLAAKGWLPAALARVGRRTKTPLVATATVLFLMAGGLILPLVSLAQATSLLVLVAFILVNVSLVVVKRRGVGKSKLMVPIAVPSIGTVLCLLLVLYQVVQWLSA